MDEEDKTLEELVILGKECYLDKLENLKNDDHYLDIVFLCLCCFIDELANLIYKNKNTTDRFKMIFQEYYVGNEYELIDLLFLCQWERSELMREPLAQRYIEKLKESKNICDDVKNQLKISENDIKDSNVKRYFSVEDLLEKLSLSSSNKDKYRECLKNFSNSNVLYRFGRCASVHKGYTILLNASMKEDRMVFKSNHLITPDFLIETLRGILKKMQYEAKEGRLKFTN